MHCNFPFITFLVCQRWKCVKMVFLMLSIHHGDVNDPVRLEVGWRVCKGFGGGMLNPGKQGSEDSQLKSSF